MSVDITRNDVPPAPIYTHTTDTLLLERATDYWKTDRNPEVLWLINPTGGMKLEPSGSKLGKVRVTFYSTSEIREHYGDVKWIRVSASFTIES